MDVEGMDKMGTTTAKLMTTIEGEFKDCDDVEIKHVMVICEMDYVDEDGERASHVILETDVDSRIIQLGMATAAQAAALYGEAVKEDRDE